MRYHTCLRLAVGMAARRRSSSSSDHSRAMGWKWCIQLCFWIAGRQVSSMYFPHSRMSCSSIGSVGRNGGVG